MIMSLDKKKLLIIRARTGFTSRELAARYGCSKAQINMLFNKKQVRPETAGKLAAALNCDVTEIIEG